MSANRNSDLLIQTNESPNRLYDSDEYIEACE